jgi:hypothetical protein
MASATEWLFVDDRLDEASAFAELLSGTGLIKVRVISPEEARSALLQRGSRPLGVLMDVDLSSIQGEFGTGPGIAQDIRTKQKAGLAAEFPIVRFSAAEPLIKNVVGDPSSDDLFELTFLKDDFKYDYLIFSNQLIGVGAVYQFFTDSSVDWELYDESLAKLFGIPAAKLGEWTHEGLRSKLLTGMRHAPHVAAGVFCRLFLLPSGLLIDCDLLAVRLGVDIAASGESWTQLLKHLEPVIYAGIAGPQFLRWWARGVEEWWYGTIDKSNALSGTTVANRVSLIQKATGIDGLRSIQATAGQTETRFWQFCRLAMASRPMERIPVDPSDAVRLISQVDLPHWVEPWYASPRLALREKKDPRLNQKDLERLRKKYKV